MRKAVKCLTVFFVFAVLVHVSAYGAQNKSIAESRLIIFNGESKELITGIDKHNELTFKLKEIMEFLGYNVFWNGEKSSITMENAENTVTVRVNAKICDKNGSLMYVTNPIILEDGYTYVSQSFLRDIMGISVTTLQTEQPDRSNFDNPVILQTDELVFDVLQEKADNGEVWRTKPEEVAAEYIRSVLGYEGGELIYQGKGDSEFTRVSFNKEDGDSISVTLYQPAKKGEGGIWEVESWTDTDYRHYQVRDLSKLQPLFHHTQISKRIKDALRNEIVRIWGDEYIRYYKVLGFEAANVEYVEADGKIEAKFNLAIVTKNYYKDPDTVEYIKEAKERGSASYLILYDEYNMARMGNYDIKIVADLTAEGDIDTSSISVLHNVSPNGEIYELMDIKNYFFSEPSWKPAVQITKDMSVEAAIEFLSKNITVGMNIDALGVLTGCAPIRVMNSKTSREVLRYDVLCADGYFFEEETDILDIDAMTEGRLTLVLFVHQNDNGTLLGFTVYHFDSIENKVYESGN